MKLFNRTTIVTFVSLWLLVGLVIGLLSMVMNNKSSKATYRISSEKGKTYYSNSFRVYGRGIIFDDINGRTVIVQGDLEIVKQTKNE
jgi:hypothetical protein